MTVKELIDVLSKFPGDTPVIRTYFSDFDEVEAGQIDLMKAEDKRVVERGGRLVRYIAYDWPKDEVPKFVTVVHFAGL